MKKSCSAGGVVALALMLWCQAVFSAPTVTAGELQPRSPNSKFYYYYYSKPINSAGVSYYKRTEDDSIAKRGKSDYTSIYRKRNEDNVAEPDVKGANPDDTFTFRKRNEDADPVDFTYRDDNVASSDDTFTFRRRNEDEDSVDFTFRDDNVASSDDTFTFRRRNDEYPVDFTFRDDNVAESEEKRAEGDDTFTF